MTTTQLIEELQKIIEVHPEAGEAQVWAYSDEADFRFHVQTIGWDSRHKPKRIKLE